MTVCYLTASYAVAWREMILDDFWLPFARITTIWSLVLVFCVSISATVYCDTLLIYSALVPEDTCTEAFNARVFMVKLVGLRGC